MKAEMNITLWDEQPIRNWSPYHTLWLTNLSNYTLYASLSLLICEWSKQLHRFIKKPGSTPTSHPLHWWPFKLSHGQTIPEPSQESHAFMWHACRATVLLDSSTKATTTLEVRVDDLALALHSATFSSSFRRSTIHSPFSFLAPSPATMHGSKRGGVVTSVVDNSTTPGSKRGLKYGGREAKG